MPFVDILVPGDAQGGHRFGRQRGARGLDAGRMPRVPAGVNGHARRGRPGAQGHAFAERRGRRLFEEHGQPCVDRAHRDRVPRSRWGADGDRIERARQGGDHGVDIGEPGHADAGIAPARRHRGQRVAPIGNDGRQVRIARDLAEADDGDADGQTPCSSSSAAMNRAALADTVAGVSPGR